MIGETVEGGCYCGRIRYRLAADGCSAHACHCRDCQRLTGSAFAINIRTEPSGVEVTAGDPTTDGEGVVRCPACLTALWAMHPLTGDALYLRAGTLDEAERFGPTAHFFVRSKHPWVTLPPDVRAYNTLPDRTGASS